MQAHEKIAFIEKFDVLTTRESLSDIEKETAFQAFVGLCDDLMHAYPENVQSYSTFSDGYFKNIVESPLTIQAEDGTYLHVLSYGQGQPEGYYDIGFALVLHDAKHNWVEGYIYGIEDDLSIVRSAIGPVVNALTEDEPLKPFSVIGHQKAIEELAEAGISENEYERAVAEGFQQRLDDALLKEDVESAFGGSKSPSLSELESLKHLFAHAVPYTAGEGKE